MQRQRSKRHLGARGDCRALRSLRQRNGRSHATRLVRRIEPHLAQLSSVVAVVVDSNADELAAILERRGISCSTIAVDAKLARGITAGEPLAW